MGHPRAFRQTDVTRALRAAQAAGLNPHVWIAKDGSIHVAGAGPDALTPTPANAPSEGDDTAWDEAFD